MTRTGIFTKERGEFGAANEKLLHPILEKLHGQEFRHTIDSRDTMDYVSTNYWVEIKTRKQTFSHTDEVIKKEGWLLPFCKIERALNERKKVLFYYYWKKDRSLWVWNFEETAAKTLKSFVPHFHAVGQKHVAVPADWWILVGYVDEQEGCLRIPARSETS